MRMRKTKHLVLLLCAIFLAAISLSGCEKQQEDYDYYIYYLNTDSTDMVGVGYEPASETSEGLIEEFAGLLCTETDSVDYRPVITGDVELISFELENNILRMYFNADYYEMESAAEVMVRGAIVHTMVQIDGVDAVSIYVDGEPLTDANGDSVGILTYDSFIENPGEQINSFQEAQVTLYFANETGDGLVSEVQHVYYSSNISLEKLIMERLIAGPETASAQSAIPEGTTLIGVSVMDGVAVVNLDEGFLTQNYDISESVVIYSIVNSLTELDTVDKVQISVNGETNMVYRDSCSLSEFYTQDLSLIAEEGDEVSVEQNEGDSQNIVNE